MSDPVDANTSLVTTGAPTDVVPIPLVAAESLPVGDFTVIARTPQEMQQAQASLVAWAERKLTDEKAAHAELAENLAIACTRKWKISTLQRAEARAQRRVEFYAKVHAALVAGYCIVPNLPVQVFAIRTTARVRPNPQTSEWRVPLSGRQESNSPSAGEGRYVSPQAIDHRYVQGHTILDSTGKIRTQNRVVAVRHDDEIDFPFALAKPQILDATAKAQALQVFDDLGVLHGQKGWKATQPTQDPLVVGRVILRDGPYRRAISFLVAWFVDTAGL